MAYAPCNPDLEGTERVTKNLALHITDWKVAIWSGLTAGLVFLMLEMLLVRVFQGMSPWAPLRMMAAMVLG